MRLIYSAFMLFSSIMVSQTYPDKNALEQDWEQWRDQIPVSGNVRVGLMLDQADDSFNPGEFYVVIPDSTKVGNLCVELSSKDGRYSANIYYDVSELTSGKQQFILPTKYKSELLQYKANEVVILATLNTDCKSNAQTYLVSGWVKTAQSEFVSVYVNSSLPTSVIVIKSDATEIMYNCNSVELPAIAYNKKCQIPLKQLQNTTVLTIRERAGRGNKTAFYQYKMPLEF